MICNSHPVNRNIEDREAARAGSYPARTNGLTASGVGANCIHVASPVHQDYFQFREYSVEISEMIWTEMQIDFQ